jgi:type II secretory pathway pseudopilin PulG
MKVMLKRRGGDGFTVVEMLLGIALFGIIIPTIILAMNAVSMLNENSKDLAIANIYAENKIEEFRSLGYNSLATGTTSVTAELPSALGKDRSGSYTVTTPVTGQKNISLTITIENRGRTKTLTYTTIIGELGVGQ